MRYTAYMLHCIYRTLYEKQHPIPADSKAISYTIPPSSTAHPGRTAEGRGVRVPPSDCVEAASSVRVSAVADIARSESGDGS